jgi:hypothetical protein
LTRLSTSFLLYSKEDVDARHKAGHDELCRSRLISSAAFESDQGLFHVKQRLSGMRSGSITDQAVIARSGATKQSILCLTPWIASRTRWLAMTVRPLFIALQRGELLCMGLFHEKMFRVAVGPAGGKRCFT